MSKLKIVHEKGEALRKLISAMFGVPLNKVQMDIYIYDSPEAFAEAGEDEYLDKKTTGGVEWRYSGDYLRGTCITVYKAE